jgi:hypothetical protein
MLFGSDMGHHLDTMYRPAEFTQTRYEYPTEVRKNLTDAYERAQDRLNLAHLRQKDNYDRRLNGNLYSPGNLVWL